MLFTTPTQFAALALLLFVGWLFGLASSGGGRKWHKRYGEEHAAYATYRHETDVKLRDANRRIVELEKANSRLADDHAASRTAYADLEARHARPVAAAAATPAFAPAQSVVERPVVERTDTPRKAWFAWDRDRVVR